MDSKRTIRVTGKGRLKLKPDMTRITMTLKKVCPEYDEALRSSAESTAQLKELFSGFGFKGSDLKTLSFDIDTEYESYRERGEYKERFAGYKYEHILKVEFDSDNGRLGKILYALANSPLRPEFRISYTVKDEEKEKNRLLGNAVRDAMEKAGVLSAAAGVEPGEILSIDYSWGEIDFESRPVNRMMAGCCDNVMNSCCELDIEPDDIDVSDTVTVIWEIR
ncbi:MAG: SIMPL domain-containing protein [Candidatus Limivicinus sp.]|jgi:uncharacterized protein YggE